MSDFFYKNLDTYKIAKDFVLYTYHLLKKYPSFEQYALCDQLRRSSISVPSNIAEGMGRMAVKERIHFLEIAYASFTSYVWPEKIVRKQNVELTSIHHPLSTIHEKV